MFSHLTSDFSIGCCQYLFYFKGFPGPPMVKTLWTQMQGSQVGSLVGELRSHMLQGMAKNKIKNIFIWYFVFICIKSMSMTMTVVVLFFYFHNSDKSGLVVSGHGVYYALRVGNVLPWPLLIRLGRVKSAVKQSVQLKDNSGEKFNKFILL